MVNPSDKAALQSLLTKFVIWYDESAADRAAIAEAQARLNARNPQLEKLQAAFSLYGYGTSTEDWNRLKLEIGEAAYNQALEAGGRPPKTILPPENPEKKEVGIQGDLLALPAATPVREVALQYLKSKAPSGVKAREIKDFIEKLRGESLHEKTVGMTLYRLSEEGRTRREGRTWFFVSEETKNPGASTPGLINRVTQKE